MAAEHAIERGNDGGARSAGHKPCGSLFHHFLAGGGIDYDLNNAPKLGRSHWPAEFAASRPKSIAAFIGSPITIQWR
jgi:hypothetical protein